MKREWWIDLPELTSIRLGEYAFQFMDDYSTELIMRSGFDNMNWWIDLPKLTSLTTEGEYSSTFRYQRYITLEGIPYHSILTSRYALSHYCYSLQGTCIPIQENPSYQESLFLPSLIHRHHSCSPRVSPVHCFFHTPFSLQHQIAVFTSHNYYNISSSLTLFLFLPVYRMLCYQAFLHSNSLIS